MAKKTAVKTTPTPPKRKRRTKEEMVAYRAEKALKTHLEIVAQIIEDGNDNPEPHDCFPTGHLSFELGIIAGKSEKSLQRRKEWESQQRAKDLSDFVEWIKSLVKSPKVRWTIVIFAVFCFLVYLADIGVINP